MVQGQGIKIVFPFRFLLFLPVELRALSVPRHVFLRSPPSSPPFFLLIGDR
jgi:hypothetical protein